MGVLQESVSGALGPEELAERLKDVHVLGIRSKMQASRALSAACLAWLLQWCYHVPG